MLEGVDRVKLTSFGLLAIRIVLVAPNWASLPSAEEVFFTTKWVSRKERHDWC